MNSAKAERAANSFEVVAREWFSKYSPGWAPNHASRLIRLFERDIFPWIGGRPIAEVHAPELLGVLRRIENRGALDTAHRALNNCGQVFRHRVHPAPRPFPTWRCLAFSVRLRANSASRG